MNRVYAIVITLFFSIISGFAADTDDNVISPLNECTYTIHEKNGLITNVKCNTVTTFYATRHDERVIDYIFYSDKIKLDKFSAPGVKPIYRAYEGDNMFYTGSKICIADFYLNKGKEKKIVSERTFVDPEQFCDIRLDVNYFTLESITKILVPKALANRINVKLYNAPDSLSLEKCEEKDGTITYILKQTNVEPYKKEPMAPPFALNSPTIIITGVFENLQALYNYFKSFCSEEDPDSMVVKELAKTITVNCKTDLERIDSIANWVRQNIRYIAIEHGDYAMKPDMPSQVVAKRFGDCKCSANLIKALMKSVGIDARLVWVGTNDEIITDWDTTPALCSGNHMIAAALLPDSIVYIDGTAAFSPAGYVSSMISGRKALIEDGDNYMLADIPKPSDSESALYGSFIIENDNLVGTMNNILTGAFRVSFARKYFTSDTKSREILLRRWLIYPKKNVVCSDGRVILDSPSAPQLTISADVIDKGSARSVGNLIYVDLLPIRDFVLEPISLKDRKYGVYMPFDYTLTTEFDCVIPDGYKVRELPSKAIFDSEWFQGEIEYTNNDNIINCKAKVHYIKSDIPFSKVADWNNALKIVNQASNNQIVLIKE